MKYRAECLSHPSLYSLVPGTPLPSHNENQISRMVRVHRGRGCYPGLQCGLGADSADRGTSAFFHSILLSTFPCMGSFLSPFVSHGIDNLLFHPHPLKNKKKERNRTHRHVKHIVFEKSSYNIYEWHASLPRRQG